MFKKHILKLSIFSTFIVWLVIFLTWISFFSIRYRKNKITLKNRLEITYLKLRKQDFKNISNNLNTLSIEEVINQTLNKSTNYTHKVKKILWTSYIWFEQDKNVIFSNFDPRKCGINYICKSVQKDNYNIILAEKLNYNFDGYISNVKKYFLFSLLISILLFFPIKSGITYLTKPLEENFEFMKNFVNNAWHELKTPIANINLAAQIINTKKSYDPEIVNQIVEETSKMSKLIDTLLQLSIVSKPKEIEKVNLENTIQDILKTLNTSWYNIQLDLKQKEILANKEQIEIILKNLIENALKYNNDKKYIKIWTNKNILFVENSWDQLTKQQIKRIFDIFYRANTKKQGYWLGLAIVKKIVEVNWWKIKVKSENGINRFEIKFK